MKLRDYQKNAECAVIAAWKNGQKRVLVVMPTGTGKTVLFSSICRSQFPGRTLIIAHREELIWQARDKIQKVTDLRADIEMAQYKASVDSDLLQPVATVVVATIQTLMSGSRRTKFNFKDFKCLVIDEAHHATASSYRQLIDLALEQNPNINIVGVTATPDRSDEEALGQIFESVAFDYEILDAINDGWLVPVEQQVVSVDSLDYSSIRTTAGDLNGADLAEVMESEKNLHGVASATIDIAGTRRGIGFASSVNHARILSEIFNRHRTGMSNWVCGKTDKIERKQIIADFARGKTQFLWNCGVFTEGFDDSGVEIISMGRPTKSRSLYAQMAGRATRPHESIAHALNDVPDACLRRMMIKRSIKPSCLILDFAGNSGKHKLITTADILGGNVSDEAVKAAIETARQSGKPMRMKELLEEEELKLAEKKKRELEAAARKARIKLKASFKIQNVNPFDALKITPGKMRGWDEGKLLSEGQKKVMREHMNLNPDDYKYHDAKKIIDAQFLIWQKAREGGYRAPSFKMINKLSKHGIDARFMPIQKAGEYLDAIKSNGWQGVPDGFKPKADVVIPPRPIRVATLPPQESEDWVPF